MAGQEVHPLTGLNLTFISTHFKQTLGIAAILLVNWLSYSERIYSFIPKPPTPCPDFTYFARKTETNHFNCLIFPPSSYLCVYTIYSVHSPVRKVNGNHPSIQGQPAHWSSLTQGFRPPLFPSHIKVLCHRSLVNRLRSDFWPTSSFEGLLSNFNYFAWSRDRFLSSSYSWQGFTVD